MKRRPLIVNRVRPMARPLPVNGREPAPAARGDESWFRIVNATRTGGTAEVYIYDEIGYWGVSAQRFIDELRELDADTIELHINSPGGEVYDGIAIYNAILNHPAQVNVTVDALAASAASFIAQAGHTVTMAANSEMMIHDAIGIAWDNADGLRELADRLDKVSDNIAAIYADRAGGTAASWRKTMRGEAWYSADEAVAAGLADAVVKVAQRGAADATENRWSTRRDAISARFRYANRGATVAPVRPDIADETGPEVIQVATPPAELAADTRSLIDPDLLRTALHLGLGDVGFVEPDTFHALIDDVVHSAPTPAPTAGALTRTVPLGGYGTHLQDTLREAVTG